MTFIVKNPRKRTGGKKTNTKGFATFQGTSSAFVQLIYQRLVIFV